MGFFTTDWNLGNAFNNPSVGRTQPFMPGAGSLSATQNINPFQWTPQPSNQRQTNWGAPNAAPGAGGYQGTGNSYNFAGTVGSQNPFGNMYGGYGGFNQQQGQQPWWMNQQQQQPINQSQQRGMSPRPQSDGGSDYEDTLSDPNASFNSLQSYLNAPEWQRDMTAAFVPFGLGSSFARGINQDGTTKSWYEGSTDDYGNAYLGGDVGNKTVGASERNLSRDFYGNTLSSYQMNKDAGMLGGQTWGDYYRDAKTQRAGQDALGVQGPGMFGDFFDGWFTQDPTNVPIVEGNRPYDYRAGVPPSPLALTQTQQNVLDGEKSMNQMQAQVDAAKAAKAAAASTPWSNPSISDLPSAPDTTSSVDFGNYSADVTNEGGGYYSSVDESAPAGYQDIGWEDPNPSSDDGGSSGGGGGGSYIATAATQALGEGGLKVFEDWRDYMHSWHPTFTASFGRYRVTAPKIVEEINKSDNPKGIYNYIWDMHLKPIFDLISEDKDSKKALKDYKIMVRELSNKFLRKEKV